MLSKRQRYIRHTLPREKAYEKGTQGLRDDELIALILGTGSKHLDVFQVSKNVARVLRKFSVTTTLHRELSKISGVGESKSARLCAALELGKRISSSETIMTVCTPNDVLKVTAMFRNKKREYFVGIYVDARYQLISTDVISIGSIDTSIAHPREVFAPAIRKRASGVIVAHNHPSGDPEPSHADLLITKRLLEAGKILDIELHDHIIITKNKHLSLKTEGLVF